MHYEVNKALVLDGADLVAGGKVLHPKRPISEPLPQSD